MTQETEEQILDTLKRIELGLYGDIQNKQKGIIEIVNEHARKFDQLKTDELMKKIEDHEIEIRSFKDIKSKGAWLWKIIVGSVGLFGYLIGKAAEHGLSWALQQIHHN